MSNKMITSALSEAEREVRRINADDVLETIETAIGVRLDSADTVLRNWIPNSLTFLQMLLALQDEYAVSIDYGSLNPDVTSAELAGIIETARQRSDLEPANTIATASDHSAVATGEQHTDFAADQTEHCADFIPLNPIQTAYLLGADKDIELGGQATYVYTESWHDYPPCQVAEAVQTVYERHDVLFHRLDVDAGGMRPNGSCCATVEVVAAEVDSAAEVEDIRRAMRAAAESSNDCGPLVAARVLSGSGGCRLFIYFNMIVMDAGSVYLFFDELESVLAGRALPPASTYQAAVAAISTRNRAKTRAEDLEYWENKAAELPLRPEFPAVVSGEDNWSTRRLHAVLNSEVFAGLEERARRIGVTASALVMAVNSAVICRWLPESALTVNVTVSARSALSPTTRVMGDFTSSILVGVDTGGINAIDHLAKRIDREIRAGLSHSSVSGVEVLQKFLRHGANQTQATAPVVFTSYLGGAQGSSRSSVVDCIYTQTAQVCLDIQVMPTASGVALSWDVVDAYFPAADAMFAAAAKALAVVAAGGEVLPIRDNATEQAVSRYNDVAAPIPQSTLLSLVRDAYLATPGAQAVRLISRGISYTYAEVWAMAGRIAQYLAKAGVKRGDAVIIRYTKHPDDIVNMVGVLRAGAAFVPIDANMPAQRQEYVLETAGAVGPIVETGLFDELTQTHEAGSGNSQATEAEFVADSSSVATSPDDIAYIIFTSGTTGRPKGVRISHRNCVNTIVDVNRRYEVTAEDRIIGLSSLGFDLSVYDIFGTFAAGATVTMVSDERDADEILDVLRKEQVTLWNSAPALLELALVRASESDIFPSVRTVMLSGDRIAAGLPARAEEIFPNATINSLGGATEGSIWSIHYPLQSNSLESRIPYGYPLANQGIHILAPDNVRCPIGVPGEIHISGVGVAQGYAANPKLSAAAFVDIPGLGRCYKTGDIGVFNAEGFVEFRGRRDRQVKIAGFRVELGEIESVLDQSGLVSASIAAVTESGGRNILACLYVPRKQRCSKDDVASELSRALPKYMIPTILLPVAHLPVTINGKLDQAEIQRFIDGRGRTEAADGSEATAADAGAGKNYEVDPIAVDVVSDIFDELLGAASPAARAQSPGNETDSFFNRGGDSLQFQMMMRIIQQRTGVRLRFRDVITDPSIPHIAALIAQGLRQGQQSAHDDAGAAGSGSGALCTAPAASDCSLTVREEDPMREFGDDPYAPFPLTDMQKAYYVGRKAGFELGGVTEHYYVEFLTEPGIDIARLEDALNQIISRHPMLRAVFTTQATQTILPEVPRYCIEVIDYRAADESTVAAAVQRKREELSHQVFDLGSWPLFCMSAFALPNGQHRLFFSVDMIIGDGASQRIFLADLDKAYRGVELSPVRGDYRRYVLNLKRREALSNGRGDSAVERAVIESFPPGNTLPGCAAHKVVDAPRMRRLSHTFTAHETALLHSQASAANGSVSALLLACYATSLSLWSGGGTVGINVTTYNRNPDIAAVEDVFGDFTGVILMPVQAPTDHDLRWWTAQLRARVFEHMESGYSGVSLLGAIARHRGLSVGNAIAPFVFTSLLFGDGVAARAASQRRAHVLGKVDYAISQTPQVLLDNQVMEIDGCLNISWDFVEQILEPEMMNDIFDHFIRSVAGFANGNSEAASLSSAQVHRLLRKRQEVLLTGAVEEKSSAVGENSDAMPPSAGDGQLSANPVENTEGTAQQIDGYLEFIQQLVRADLGCATVGAEEDLFALGYDSLRFVTLIQRIQDSTGVTVPLAQALGLPTPRGVAELVAEALNNATSTQDDRRSAAATDASQRDRSLVLLRSGDPARPVFFVHGGFGTVDIYRDLALAIPGDMQVWGISFKEFERPFPRATDIGDIAAHYSAKVREILVDRAVPALAGWSLGGTIAAEMALQLADLNPALILLDSLAPGIAVDVGNFTSESEKVLLCGVLPTIAELPKETSVAELWAELEKTDATSQERGARLRTLAAAVAPTLLADLGISGNRVTATEFNSLRSLINARTKYRPRGRVPEALFILPDDGEAHNHNQWFAHLVDDLRTVGVAGNHYSFVLGEDAVRTGALIGKYLKDRCRALGLNRPEWKMPDAAADRLPESRLPESRLPESEKEGVRSVHTRK